MAEDAINISLEKYYGICFLNLCFDIFRHIVIQRSEMENYTNCSEFCLILLQQTPLLKRPDTVVVVGWFCFVLTESWLVSSAVGIVAEATSKKSPVACVFFHRVNTARSFKVLLRVESKGIFMFHQEVLDLFLNK